MKKLLAVVAVLLVALLMTQMVPDKQAHKEAMLKAINEFVESEAESRGFADNVLTDIGKGVVVKAAEVALNTKLRVKNYYLFNTTYVRLKGKDQTLSLGLFGHVFTFDKEMLHDKLQQALEAKEEAISEKAEAKQSARELRKLQREQKRREKELRKEQERLEKEAKKEQERREKAAKKERERREKEAKKAQELREKEAKRLAKKAEKEAKRIAKEAEEEAKRKAKEALKEKD